MNRGVCAHVIVRAFRAIDVHLQVAIHEDMQRNFRAARGRNDFTVMHNIGYGALNEDVLRAFQIIGHYRW